VHAWNESPDKTQIKPATLNGNKTRYLININPMMRQLAQMIDVVCNQPPRCGSKRTPIDQRRRMKTFAVGSIAITDQRGACFMISNQQAR
jgi:hypothetical protein